MQCGALAQVIVEVGHLLRDRAGDAIRTVSIVTDALVAAPLRTVTSRSARAIVFEDGTWAGGTSTPWRRPVGPFVEHGPWRKREWLTPPR